MTQNKQLTLASYMGVGCLVYVIGNPEPQVINEDYKPTPSLLLQNFCFGFRWIIKFTMRKIVILLASVSFGFFYSQTIGNEEIIQMKKENLSKPLILNTIKNSSDFNFDTSTKGLKQLSDNGIDDEIVILIMDKQKDKSENNVLIDGISIAKNEYGLIANDNGKKVKIHSHLSQPEVGRTLKTSLQNTTSDISVNKGVNVFYFNFSVDETVTSNTSFNLNNSISDPNEGELVKLSKSSKKREFELGKVRITGLKTEIPEKIRVEYKVEKVKHNIYKLTTVRPLEAGEYGFVFGGVVPGVALKIYDFTVK